MRIMRVMPVHNPQNPHSACPYGQADFLILHAFLGPHTIM